MSRRRARGRDALTTKRGGTGKRALAIVSCCVGPPHLSYGFLFGAHVRFRLVFMRSGFSAFRVLVGLTAATATGCSFGAIVQGSVPALVLEFLVFAASARTMAAGTALAVCRCSGGRRHFGGAFFGLERLVVDRGDHGRFDPHPGAKGEVEVGVQKHRLNYGVEAQERAELVPIVDRENS